MTLRTFGALQWECVTPGFHWKFSDGWGVFRLWHFNSHGQEEGWYLETPDRADEWMGSTLTEATAAAEPKILSARPRG